MLPAVHLALPALSVTAAGWRSGPWRSPPESRRGLPLPRAARRQCPRCALREGQGQPGASPSPGQPHSGGGSEWPCGHGVGSCPWCQCSPWPGELPGLRAAPCRGRGGAGGLCGPWSPPGHTVPAGVESLPLSMPWLLWGPCPGWSRASGLGGAPAWLAWGRGRAPAGCSRVFPLSHCKGPLAPSGPCWLPGSPGSPFSGPSYAMEAWAPCPARRGLSTLSWLLRPTRTL